MNFPSMRLSVCLLCVLPSAVMPAVFYALHMPRFGFRSATAASLYGQGPPVHSYSRYPTHHPLAHPTHLKTLPVLPQAHVSSRHVPQGHMLPVQHAHHEQGVCCGHNHMIRLVLNPGTLNFNTLNIADHGSCAVQAEQAALLLWCSLRQEVAGR